MIAAYLLFFLLFSSDVQPKIVTDLHYSLPKNQKKKALEDDATFMIIDLKYKKGCVKICEFGAGRLSGFIGIDRLKHPHYIEQEFAKALSNLDLPLNVLFCKKKNDHALKSSVEYLQNMFHGVKQLEYTTDPEDVKCKNIKNISLCCPATALREAEQYNLGKGILLDKSSYAFAVNKLLMHLLFAHDERVKRFRPHCCIVERVYTPTLAQEILNQIPSELIVLKPINGWKGSGVLITTREELEPLLRNILSDHSRLTSNQLRYWAKYKEPYFLAESYEASEPFVVQHKTYDPTMRIAFVMSRIQGNTCIQVLDAYWKLPACPQESKASLVAKCISHISPKSSLCSALVKQSVLDDVTKQLNFFMPIVYEKMIALSKTDQLKSMIPRADELEATANQ